MVVTLQCFCNYCSQQLLLPLYIMVLLYYYSTPVGQVPARGAHQAARAQIARAAAHPLAGQGGAPQNFERPGPGPVPYGGRRSSAHACRCAAVVPPLGAEPGRGLRHDREQRSLALHPARFAPNRLRKLRNDLVHGRSPIMPPNGVK